MVERNFWWCSTVAARVWAPAARKTIRRAIYAHPVKTATEPGTVSMSLGVAGTEVWQESHAERLIHKADMAL